MVETHDDIRHIGIVEGSPVNLLFEPSVDWFTESVKLGGISEDNPALPGILLLPDLQVGDYAPNLDFLCVILLLHFRVDLLVGSPQGRQEHS